MRIAVILPAAGSGTRFGAKRPKQFLKLGDSSIFDRTVRFFTRYPGVAEIIVAVPPAELTRWTKQIARPASTPAIRVVAGGATRQASVLKALQAAGPVDWVAVHDVVRPLVDAKLFALVLDGARKTGAAIPGLPVSDTLKRIDRRGRVEETVPREAYVQAQTPQVFRRSLLQRAFKQAEADCFLGTDEASLVERLGVAVQVVPGSRRNIKITVPEDHRWAEWILRGREGRGK